MRLTDLGALVGGISKENGVTVLAKDGYGMTLSYAQAHGEEFTTFDPATGMEEPPSFPLNVIIAYARNGKPLDPEGEGPLRLEIAQDEAAQLVDGHWTVKWLDRVEVKKATSDWSVVLKGAVDAQLTRLVQVVLIARLSRQRVDRGRRQLWRGYRRLVGSCR